MNSLSGPPDEKRIQNLFFVSTSNQFVSVVLNRRKIKIVLLFPAFCVPISRVRGKLDH